MVKGLADVKEPAVIWAAATANETRTMGAVSHFLIVFLADVATS